VHAIFRHDYPLAVEPASTPRPLVQKSLRDSLPIHMLLSAVYFLVVAQSSSEIPEGLMNNPVYSNYSLVRDKSGSARMYAGKDSDEMKFNIFSDRHQHFKGK